VAEQCLDDAQVCATIEKLGSKGVTKEMRVEPDAETSAGARYRVDDGPLADAAAPGGQEGIARPE
jgi:hypothetical protein